MQVPIFVFIIIIVSRSARAREDQYLATVLGSVQPDSLGSGWQEIQVIV